VMIAAQTTLEERLRAKCRRAHALMAEVAEMAVEFDDSGEWRGIGLRSCADWLVVDGGFDRHTADALMRAGRAARELPEVGEAFSTGELSLDKVRSLSSVATAEDQGVWVEVAGRASPPQLGRMCRESRTRVDEPERDRAQRAQRSLRMSWDELGRLRLSGALPTEQGEMFRIAVEQEARRLRATRRAAAPDADPAEDPFLAQQADALVMICERSLGGGSAGAAPARAQLVVHVDAGVLTGETPNGRGHLDDGPALSTPVLRRLACDASLVRMIERDGVPIDVGRAKPVVQPAMRRAVESRDRTCRFPKCAVPATRWHCHHIHHWIAGGPTELWNLAALCSGHHNGHHRGEFDIWRSDQGDLTFTTPGYEVIGKATGGAWKRPKDRAGP